MTMCPYSFLWSFCDHHLVLLPVDRQAPTSSGDASRPSGPQEMVKYGYERNFHFCITILCSCIYGHRCYMKFSHFHSCDHLCFDFWGKWCLYCDLSRFNLLCLWKGFETAKTSEMCPWSVKMMGLSKHTRWSLQSEAQCDKNGIHSFRDTAIFGKRVC